MLTLLNDTPYPAAWLPGRVQPGRDSLTVIVKGTFRLVPQGPAEALPEGEQAPLSGDDPTDASPGSAVAYDGDWSLYKPAADVMLTGACHAPGAAVGRLAVGLALGERLRKRLVVTGPRYWLEGGRRISDPVPFRSLPLDWSGAFGGAGFAANPVGRGAAPVEGRNAVMLHPLPLIEDPETPVRSPDDRPAPAGLGPVNRRWPQRAPRSGTYDDAWIDTVWPHHPADFDWRHYLAAPPDQQVEGWLAGDEPFLLTHLHPEHAEYRGSLPGRRLQAFVSRVPDAAGDTLWRTVRLRLDTCLFDMAAETVTLVWRGLTPVSGRDHPELAELLVVETPLDGPALDVTEAPARAAALGGLADAAPGPPPEPDTPPEPDGPAAPEAPGTTADEPDLIDEIRAALAEAGMPPEVMAIAEAEDDPDRLVRRLQDLARGSIGDEAAAREAFRAHVARQREALRATLAAQGEDPGLADALMPADPFAAPPDEAESQPGPEPEPAAPDRDRVAARHAAGESLAGADLSGLDLSGIDLRGADLAGADLTGTVLAGAYLGEADLSAAILAGADLGGASLARARLDGADLTGATAAGADLRFAGLNGAVLDRADLTGARLDGAGGAHASFAGATLVDAALHDARLPGADLRGARIDGLDARGADLTQASLAGVAGEGVNLERAVLANLRATGARLPGLRLGGARAPRSIWDGAGLADLDGRAADLPNADFTGCDLARARLDLADLSDALFDNAVLAGARLVRANGLRARFDRADLTRADLTGGNFYECDLRDATIDGVAFPDAIVASTRLARLIA